MVAATQNASATLTLTQHERTHCRRVAGLARYDSRPVEIVPGDFGPQLAGGSYYYTTISGRTIIRHPGAYRWPKTYHASTRRVLVGAGWLVAMRQRRREYFAGLLARVRAERENAA